MEINTPLISSLQKTFPGQSAQSPSDGKIIIGNRVLPTVDLQHPLLFMGSSFYNADLSQSWFGGNQDIFNASAGLRTACKLLPGYWEVTWRHWNALNSANDALAVQTLDLLLETPTGAVLGPSWLSYINGNGQIQSYSGSFKVAIQKDYKLEIRLSHGVGGATSNNRVFCSIFANRLL